MADTVDMALVPVFVEVVRQGSFTKAARSLGIPKSTASRWVSRLEDQLATRLLARTTRRLHLTEAGAAFHARVAPALERVTEAVRELAEREAEPRGTLRVAVPNDVGPLLADLFKRFTDLHPEVSVEVSPSGRRVDLVAEGYDVAIRAGHLPDSSLIARKLSSSDFWLFAATSYLEAHGEPETLDELAGHRAVLFRPQSGLARWRLIGPEGVRTLEMRGAVRSDDLEFVRRAVLAGAGVGLLPEFSFSRSHERVRRILPDVHASGGGVYLVYPSAQHLPSKVTAFRDFLLASFDLPWGRPDD